jgi:aquaporin Z
MEIIGQLWLFWVAPIVGAILAGLLYYSYFAETNYLSSEEMEE